MLYAYNIQKQVIGMIDQAGTQHTYSHNKQGRPTGDAVSNVAPGIDDTIYLLENGWNERGLRIRASSRRSLDNSVANEVKWQYNAFNQPIVEYQEHAGAVNTATSKKVQYGYENGGSNTIRPTGLIYPNTHAIGWDYDTSLSAALGRPDAIRESSGAITLASFKFLGMSVPVNLKYDAAAGAELTMRNGGTGDAGPHDPYTGLDRFTRLVETIWQAPTAKLIHTRYGRNRVDGVTWQRNVLAHAITPPTAENTRQDNFYWYDSLRQNYQHQRGDLTGTAPDYTGITNLQQTEVRSFDETGNWLTDYTSSPALTQSRTHNKANQTTALNGPSGVVQPIFDLGSDGPGNMTTFPKPGAWSTAYTAKWDAWNRLVELKQGSTVITVNTYDALTRRIRKTDAAETRAYFYDRQWRSLEEHVGGTVQAQFLWSPFDRWTLIRRQRSVSGTLDETKYLLKDYLDPAALINSSGTVEERYSYDAFGPVRILDAAFAPRAGNTSNHAWNFLFHAEFLDVESGLYNYEYRFYHPNLGRWPSRDPIGERGGLNFYGMVGNDTLNRFDNIGLAEIAKATPGVCGQANWYWNWTLTGPSSRGTIVQKMSFTGWQRRCGKAGKSPKTSPFNGDVTYTEYWSVGVSISNGGMGIFPNPKDKWNPGLVGGYCTEGEITIRGEARFYPDVPVPILAYDRRYRHPFSQDLPSLIGHQWPQSGQIGPANTLSRTMTLSWNCCKGKETLTKVTTDVKSQKISK